MKDDITNPLSIVSKKTRTEIVRAALKYDKKALADFYSRDVGGFFPGFSHAKN
jgi:hypothetical protein